jgi:hypothetical protein
MQTLVVCCRLTDCYLFGVVVKRLLCFWGKFFYDVPSRRSQKQNRICSERMQCGKERKKQTRKDEKVDVLGP